MTSSSACLLAEKVGGLGRVTRSMNIINWPRSQRMERNIVFFIIDYTVFTPGKKKVVYNVTLVKPKTTVLASTSPHCAVTNLTDTVRPSLFGLTAFKERLNTLLAFKLWSNEIDPSVLLVQIRVEANNIGSSSSTGAHRRSYPLKSDPWQQNCFASLGMTSYESCFAYFIRLK